MNIFLKNFLKNNKPLIYIIGLLIVIVIFINSALDLYEKRDKIKNKISKDKIRYNYLTDKDELDKVWANKILDGGYILYFRHAEREKWLDLITYDAVEMIKGLDAENTTFKYATCLSDRGKEQAKIMNEIIDMIGGLKVQEIISSPSCRARQTANIVFNKNIDRMNNDLLHYGPFNESRKDLFVKLRTFLITLKPDNDKNIIITGHNSVMDTPIFHKDNIVDFNMEEGGFIVIKNLNGKLLAQHKFYLFSDFSKRLLKRPEN